MWDLNTSLNIGVAVSVVLGLLGYHYFFCLTDDKRWQSARSIREFTAVDIHGKLVDISLAYRIFRLLIVNVAYECKSADSQFKILKEIYDRYRHYSGLRILAFPCNQFSGKDNYSGSALLKFTMDRGIQFHIFDKVDVNGPNAHPLWQYLKHTATPVLGDDIKGDFTKFIVNHRSVPKWRCPPNMTLNVSNNMGEENWKDAKSVYEFTVKDIKGEDVSLEKYRGHPLLIVNVASECGLTTTNYKELVELDEKYRESKGLRILAFPCNQFGEQEPGNADDIVCFAKSKNAKFDMFEKIEVNGPNAHPLWKYLKYKLTGTMGNAIKWNFTKFLIDKNGQPVKRFSPTTAPHKLVDTLEEIW